MPFGEGIGGMPIDAATVERRAELEEQICTLAGRIAAATCEWLTMIEEFDRNDWWGGVGLLSCAHWLNLRCGMSLRTARDHLRVARALPELPAIRQAFSGGRISFSKVRALTRLATPADEAELLEFAQQATASQVETMVREWRRVNELNNPVESRRRFRLTYRYDDDGTFVFSGRLSPEDGAVFIATVERGRQLFDPDPKEPTEGGDRPEPDMSSADALVGVLTAWMQDARAPEPGRGIGEVVFLCDVASLAAPTDVERPVTVQPVGVPAPPNARRPTRSRRKGHRTFGIKNGPTLAPKTADRVLCDAATMAMLVDDREDPLDMGRRSRRPSSRLRRALSVRDGDRCQAPGCTRRGFLHAHHVRPWQYGGETKLTNLILLCPHHHRLVHEGGWSIATPAPHVFVFYDQHMRPVDHGHPLPASALPLDATVPRNGLEAGDGSRMKLEYVLGVLMTTSDVLRMRATATAALAPAA